MCACVQSVLRVCRLAALPTAAQQQRTDSLCALATDHQWAACCLCCPHPRGAVCVRACLCAVCRCLSVCGVSMTVCLCVLCVPHTHCPSHLQAYDQHLNMILGDVEEVITTVEVDDETYEEIIKVGAQSAAQHSAAAVCRLPAGCYGCTCVLMLVREAVGSARVS